MGTADSVCVFAPICIYKKQLFCFKQRRWMVNCDVKIERGEEKGREVK